MQYDGFDHLSDELENLAEAMREERPTGNRGQGFESTRGAIQEGVNTALDEFIIPDARRSAYQYVPNDKANTITHDGGEWIGKRTYRHSVYSESDLVAFHEFGTGGRAEHPTYPGTVNAETDDGRPGYIIEPDDADALKVEINGRKFFFQQVVHPGIRARHFIENAMNQSSEILESEISNAITQRFGYVNEYTE